MEDGLVGMQEEQERVAPASPFPGILERGVSRAVLLRSQELRRQLKEGGLQHSTNAAKETIELLGQGSANPDGKDFIRHIFTNLRSDISAGATIMKAQLAENKLNELNCTMNRKLLGNPVRL